MELNIRQENNETTMTELQRSHSRDALELQGKFPPNECWNAWPLAYAPENGICDLSSNMSLH